VPLQRVWRTNRTGFFAATFSLALDKSPSAARFTAVPRAAAAAPNALPAAAAFSVVGIDVNIDAFDVTVVLLVVAVRAVRNDCMVRSNFQVFFAERKKTVKTHISNMSATTSNTASTSSTRRLKDETTQQLERKSSAAVGKRYACFLEQHDPPPRAAAEYQLSNLSFIFAVHCIFNPSLWRFFRLAFFFFFAKILNFFLPFFFFWQLSNRARNTTGCKVN
jgi:hypothetical protein